MADPATVDLAAVAEAFGLGPEAAGAYRAAYPGSADGEIFVTMMSDALGRMPTTRVAEAHAGAGGRTWLYDFAWRGPALGAAHGIDVPFVFGDGDSRFAARFLGSPPPAGFAALSGEIRTAWTSFAATGDPGWPRFDPGHRRTRIWDTVPSDAVYPWRGPAASGNGSCRADRSRGQRAPLGREAAGSYSSRSSSCRCWSSERM
nr:hypothetical protein GCM10020093_060050 [Planobispora longispora]